MTTFTTDTTVSTVHAPSALRRFAHWTWARILEMRTRRTQTACLRRLNNRELQDIGLIESDVEAANNLPLSTEAAAALHRDRNDRSGNW